MEKKMWGQYVVMIAAALLLVGGVVVAAEGLLFRDCNNCTVNVPPSNVVQEVQQPVVEERLGSVSKTSEYRATSTGYLTALEDSNSLRITTSSAGFYSEYQGALGSVILTSGRTGAGQMTFIDATSTNRLMRTNQAATSSLILASLPTQNTTGTFTYDIVYRYGLLVEITGVVPTSTITYR